MRLLVDSEFRPAGGIIGAINLHDEPVQVFTGNLIVQRRPADAIWTEAS